MLVALFAAGCANRGVGPQGGPKDETPPKIVKETPLNGSVNFQGQVITLQFDEYIQLNDAANQVLISPPQKRQPTVKGVGKKVTVTFDEPLADSTTYTIDFGKSICDNNEKNPMDNYVFSFSTGPEFDSLQISGRLINAEDLNPMSGITVGIHRNLTDSAFLEIPFARIARTNAQGEFLIRNVHPGRYRIYALNDQSKDYVYQPGEGIAFLDTIIVPVAIDSLVYPVSPDSLHADSLRTDSLPSNSLRTDSFPSNSLTLHGDTLLSDSAFLVVDSLLPSALQSDSLKPDSLPADSLSASLLPKKVTRYEPSNIVLRYFTENKQRHVFERCTREEQRCFTLSFSAPQDSLPRFSLLSLANSTLPGDTLANDTLPVDTLLPLPSSFIVQSTDDRDTLTIWLTDSAYILQDTIALRMTYLASDSLYHLVQQTDTVYAIYRAPRMSAKAKEAMEKSKARKQQQEVLGVSSNASPTFDIYNPLLLRTKTPVSLCDPTRMHFYQLVDTVHKRLPFVLEKADSSATAFRIPYSWEPETSYQLDIDSAAFTDIYGLTSGRQSYKLTVRSLNDYSVLTIKVEPFNPRIMVQVLSEKDQPVRTLRATEDGARFEYLQPQSYFVRVYEDLNGDSLWTTGDWQQHLQPEPVWYFPQKLTLRANWEFEETVNYLDPAIRNEKPQEIKKDGNTAKKN